MDFTKYLDLLDSEKLFFSRPDYFDDPFEGSLTKPTAIKIDKVFSDKKVSHARKSFGEFLESFRKIIAINCWHINSQESAAMWKLYLTGNEGIAIQSTYERLRSSFDAAEEKISLACVEYVDYNIHEFTFQEGEFNFFEPYTHKRLSFAHEEELRAIYVRQPQGKQHYKGPLHKTIHEASALEKGIKIRVDIDVLVEKVYLCPTAPSWFTSLVTSVTERYGRKFPIIKSELDAEPLF